MATLLGVALPGHLSASEGCPLVLICRLDMDLISRLDPVLLPFNCEIETRMRFGPRARPVLG